MKMMDQTVNLLSELPAVAVMDRGMEVYVRTKEKDGASFELTESANAVVIDNALVMAATYSISCTIFNYFHVRYLVRLRGEEIDFVTI